MPIHELAGKPAPRSMLANIPRLVSAFYTHKPDVSDPGQRVAFGTSVIGDVIVIGDVANLYKLKYGI